MAEQADGRGNDDPNKIGRVTMKQIHILIVLAQIFVVPSVGWMISTVLELKNSLTVVATKLDSRFEGINLNDRYTRTQATQDHTLLHARIQRLEERVQRNEGWIRTTADHNSVGR